MKPFTKIGAIIFGVIALVHAGRLLSHFQLSVGNMEIPLWINVLGFVIAGFLSYGLYKESRLIPGN